MSVQTCVSIRVQKHRCRQVSNISDTDDRVWHDCPLNPHSSVCRSALVPWGGASNTRPPAKRRTFSQVHRLPAPRAADIHGDTRCIFLPFSLWRAVNNGTSHVPLSDEHHVCCQDHLPTVEPIDFNRYRYDHGLSLPS